MDHVVYLDAKANELAKLIAGNKTMIIRGAAGRKLPYGRVFEDDILYLIENDGCGLIKANARVSRVINSEKMSETASVALIEANQNELQLTNLQYERWAGKRYLVLIEVQNIEELEPFQIGKSDFGNMDDWLSVEDIDRVRIKA